MVMGFWILAGTGFFAYAVMEQSPAFSFTVASIMLAGVAAVTILVALPRFNAYFIAPAQDLAAIAGLNLEPQETLIAYGRPRPSLLFYAKRECSMPRPCIEFIKPGEEQKMNGLLARSGQIMIVTQDRLRKSLPGNASDFPVALGRYGYVLLAKKPTF
jgi:hypothetical protein